MFVPPREPWRNGTIEHFNDTFDKRFFRQERFSDRAHLGDRARRVRALPQRPAPLPRDRRPRARRDPPAPPARPAPLIETIPAGWPARGRVEFIRFIRSDHKLRLLGRAIPMPDGSAYQYLTATLDLALAEPAQPKGLPRRGEGDGCCLSAR